MWTVTITKISFYNNDPLIVSQEKIQSGPSKNKIRSSDRFFYLVLDHHDDHHEDHHDDHHDDHHEDIFYILHFIFCLYTLHL